MSIMMEKYMRAAGISTPMGRVLDQALAEAHKATPENRQKCKRIIAKMIKAGYDVDPKLSNPDKWSDDEVDEFLVNYAEPYGEG